MGMAVTHADLAPTNNNNNDNSRTAGVVLTVFSILLGLLCFVLCLIAEATRSQIIREVEMRGSESSSSSCRYSGSGKTPLICGAGAFLSLAIAMVVLHTHLLLTVSKSDLDPSQLIMSTSANSNGQHHLNTLTWQAAFFFITTWLCFSVAEVLLLIGLSVESGHLKGWMKTRPSCLIAREGLFACAGVLGITTVFLASGLSITALRAQWLLQLQDQEISNVHHHQVIMEATSYNSTPPRPSGVVMDVVDGETPIVRHHDHLYNREPGLIEYLRAFDKIIN